jgi:hypothetical protein
MIATHLEVRGFAIELKYKSKARRHPPRFRPRKGIGCGPFGYFDARPRLGLPANTRDLRIDYTGISLVAPQKVAFRFKLDGIAPAYYQTIAFRALCLLLFAGVLWGGWPLRLRHLEMTLGARAAERTRIARDLHDTLLQDSQGFCSYSHRH